MSELNSFPEIIDIGDLDVTTDRDRHYVMYNPDNVKHSLSALKKITTILQMQKEFIIKIEETLPAYYKHIKIAIGKKVNIFNPRSPLSTQVTLNQRYLRSISNFRFSYTETDPFKINLQNDIIYAFIDINPIDVYNGVIKTLKQKDSGFFGNHVLEWGNSIGGWATKSKNYEESIALRNKIHFLYLSTYDLVKAIIDAKESYTGPKPPTLLGRIKSAFTRKTPAATAFSPAPTPAAGGGGGGPVASARYPTGVTADLPTLATLPDENDPTNPTPTPTVPCDSSGVFGCLPPAPLKGGLRRRTVRARRRNSRKYRHH